MKDKSAGSEGVPRDTLTRHCLDKLTRAIAPLLTRKRAEQFIAEVIAAGYFGASLSQQRSMLVTHLRQSDQGEALVKAVLKSDDDKVRSLALPLGYYQYQNSAGRGIRFIYSVGALPGTWLQETAQTTLKNICHFHGLDKVLPEISHWVDDSNPDIRRMLIEALRPRGVWCRHLTELKEDPEPIRPLIEKLLDDKSLYVRKAVANNLNDISKDNPALLCRWVRCWMKGAISKEREWIINRGLRTLIKDGHRQAQSLLGFADPERIKLVWMRTTPRELKINHSIPFDFTVRFDGKRTTRVRLQLEMHCPGKGNKPRVSKYILADTHLESDRIRTLSKMIRFAHRNSVPRLPGKYEFHVILNGKMIGKRSAVYR